MKDWGVRLVLWGGGFLFALCPLAFDFVFYLLKRSPQPLISLIMHGEVMIIAIVIVADTFVRAVGSDDSTSVRIPLIVGCPIFLLVCGLSAGGLRGSVEAAVESSCKPVLDEFLLSRVQILSAVAFVGSLLLSLAGATRLED